MKNLLKDRRASMAVIGLIIGSVVAFLAIAIILPVGLLANDKIHDVMGDQGLSTTANATAEALDKNINAGFSLFTVSPIVLAAVGIISIIIGGLGAMLYQRMG